MTWEEILHRVNQLQPIAEKNSCSLAQLSLAWCLANPRVTTVILGATKPEQLLDNFGALSCLSKLTPSVLAEIEAVVQNKPLQPTDWNSKWAGSLGIPTGIKCDA